LQPSQSGNFGKSREYNCHSLSVNLVRSDQARQRIPETLIDDDLCETSGDECPQQRLSVSDIID
jgi:hypothetical protein